MLDKVFDKLFEWFEDIDIVMMFWTGIILLLVGLALFVLGTIIGE